MYISIPKNKYQVVYLLKATMRRKLKLQANSIKNVATILDLSDLIKENLKLKVLHVILTIAEHSSNRICVQLMRIRRFEMVEVDILI